GGAVWMLAFTPDDSALASAGEDGTVWLQGFWDESGWLKKIAGHEGAVTSLAFDADGETMLTGGLDGTIRLWDLTTDDIAVTDSRLILQGHRTAVMNIAYLYDNTLIASVSLDGSTRLWDVETGDEIAGLDAENITPLLNMTISPNRSRLISSATDGTIKLWNVDDAEISLMLEQLNPPEIVIINTPVPQVIASPNPTSVPVNPVRPTSVAIVPTPIPPVATIAPPPTVIPMQPPVPPPSLEGRSIAIPSVGMQSYVGTFYLDGVSWAIDPWVNYVGHLQGTPDLNSPGNVVVGAHSEYPDGSPGVFRSLYAVGIGDEIFVSDGATQKRYVVVNIMNVNYKDLSVVYPTAHNRLTLITCDIPSYVAEQNLYHERLVVIADEL
ncbi:MAG: sortase domain-bontaining protein, partial [Aggregatilineales bacterium]